MNDLLALLELAFSFLPKWFSQKKKSQSFSWKKSQTISYSLVSVKYGKETGFRQGWHACLQGSQPSNVNQDTTKLVFPLSDRFLPLIRPLVAISPLTVELYLLTFMLTLSFLEYNKGGSLSNVSYSGHHLCCLQLTQILQNPSSLHEDSPSTFLLFSLSDRGEPWSLGIGRLTPLDSMKQL